MSKNMDAFTPSLRDYFPSNINGMRVINASSGIAYDDTVGSVNEKNYFRVIDSSGKINKDGYKLPQGCYNATSNKLFYDSQEEWQRHNNMRKLTTKTLLSNS